MKIYHRPAIRVVSIEGDLMQDMLSTHDETGGGQLTNDSHFQMENDSPTPENGSNSVWDE
jgi:hypothetical protein